jgi:uncharacterized protein (DUF1778 family)
MGKTTRPTEKATVKAKRSRAKKAPAGKGQSAARDSRIDVRTTPEQKRLIEYAAALNGETKTTFVLRTVLESASRRIEEQSRTETTLQGWRRFWQLLSTIEKPNAALKRAARLHDELIVRDNVGKS